MKAKSAASTAVLSPLITFDHKRVVYGFAVRLQHLQRFREYSNIYKIFHPNIATNGEICVNALKKDWNPSLGLRHVLMVIRCLLIEPFPESALNEQAGKMLLENYEEYARHARIFIGIHALKSKPKIKTEAISESTVALNVDQLTSSVACVDPKNIVSGAALPPPHPTFIATSSNATKGVNNHDQSVDLTSSLDANIGASTAPSAQLLNHLKLLSFFKVIHIFLVINDLKIYPY